MDIGIGLPATIPGVRREQLLDWARRAERAGFSTLGTIDRVVYPNLESLVALAAAAAVTERIRLATSILIAPLRSGAALLAKQVATLDVISNGRVVLGLGVGSREDDFEACGVDARRRGKLFDAQLAELKATWLGANSGTGGAIGPSPVQAGGPPILIGGTGDAAIRRMAEHGSGWISGGGGARSFTATADKVRAAWAEAGRPGRPRLAGLAYYALGPDARAHADGYLRDYYSFIGQYADMIAKGAAVDEAAVQANVRGLEAAGCDEVIFFPCNPDPGQVDLLAAAVGLAR